MWPAKRLCRCISRAAAGEGEAKMSKPAKELAAFDKTDLLEPGESETLNMSFANFRHVEL